jgi:hypothetical protein
MPAGSSTADIAAPRERAAPKVGLDEDFPAGEEEHAGDFAGLLGA